MTPSGILNVVVVVVVVVGRAALRRRGRYDTFRPRSLAGGFKNIRLPLHMQGSSYVLATGVQQASFCGFVWFCLFLLSGGGVFGLENAGIYGVWQAS